MTGTPGPRTSFRVGSRGSPLARRQAGIAIDALRSIHPELTFDLHVIQTIGDQLASEEPPQLESQGWFVGAIEGALRRGEVDLAVHSFKDMPSADTPGLQVVAFMTREDPRDAIVARLGRTLEQLSAGSVVGTGSPRRRALVLEARPDLIVQSIRGNVDTRLRSVRESELDAVVVAAAGLHRLGAPEGIAQPLDPRGFVPAPGQGILAIQVRVDDEDATRIANTLDDPESRICARVERAVAEGIGAGCQTPFGAFAAVEGDSVSLTAFLADADGTIVRESGTASSGSAIELGIRMGQALIDRQKALPKARERR